MSKSELHEFRKTYRDCVLCELVSIEYKKSNKLSRIEWIRTRYKAWFNSNATRLFDDKEQSEEYSAMERSLLKEEFELSDTQIASIQDIARKRAEDQNEF